MCCTVDQTVTAPDRHPNGPINRRTRLRGDASVSLTPRPVTVGGAARAEESCEIAKPRPWATPNGARQPAQHDMRVVTFLFSENVARLNITVALAARRLHAPSADHGRSEHSIRRRSKRTVGALELIREGPRVPGRPAVQPGRGMGFHFEHGGRASRLVVGPVNNGPAQRASPFQARPTCPFGLAKRPINHTKPRLSARELRRKGLHYKQ